MFFISPLWYIDLTKLGSDLFFASTQKPWFLSVSPQSTLSAVGSWSGNGSPNGPSQVPSPPATPLGGNDAWDLIYAAAGQVARLKMNGGEGPPNGRGLLVRPRILTPLQHPAPPVKKPNTGLYANQCLSHNFTHHVSLSAV